MLRMTVTLLIAALLASACNTWNGLVTDVDHGVSKLQGHDTDEHR